MVNVKRFLMSESGFTERLRRLSRQLISGSRIQSITVRIQFLTRGRRGQLAVFNALDADQSVGNFF